MKKGNITFDYILYIKFIKDIYKNNLNYENFLKRNLNNQEEKENCKSNNASAKNFHNKSLKNSGEMIKDKAFKKKISQKYSNYENDEYLEKHEYQAMNTDLTEKPKSIRMSKNNFTFQENVK